MLIGQRHAGFSDSVVGAPPLPLPVQPDPKGNESHPLYWFQNLPQDVGQPAGRLFEHLCRRPSAAAALQAALTRDAGAQAMDLDQGSAGSAVPPLSDAVRRELLFPANTVYSSRAYDMMGLALTLIAIFMGTSMTLAKAAKTVDGRAANAPSLGLLHFRRWLMQVSEHSHAAADCLAAETHLG